MKKIALMALAAALALVVTACGGGGGGAAREITVNMGVNGAQAFDPATISATNGETLKINIVNKDTTQAHSLVIPDLNVKSSQVAPGKSEVLTVKVNKAGTISIYCDVPGHKDAGMVGKLEVK